jgi:hypothetical protein
MTAVYLEESGLGVTLKSDRDFTVMETLAKFADKGISTETLTEVATFTANRAIEHTLATIETTLLAGRNGGEDPVLAAEWAEAINS